MFGLTRQEKAVLIFIISAALIGIAASHLKKNSLSFKEFLLNRPLEENKSLVNINKAGVDELISLPGIGPELAARIIERRKAAGSFKTVADIKNVKGIGSHKYELIKDCIAIE